VLAAAEFSRELTTAVLWLNEYGPDIRCVRLQPYADGTRVLVDVQQIIPLREAREYFVNLREKQAEQRQTRRRDNLWSGLWFVNVGMDAANSKQLESPGWDNIRLWKNCVQYGYLAAGEGDFGRRLEAV
jgi:hypothetical protein